MESIREMDSIHDVADCLKAVDNLVRSYGGRVVYPFTGFKRNVADTVHISIMFDPHDLHKAVENLR